MSIASALNKLRLRAIDILGGGAAFEGVSGIAVALLAPNGEILKLSGPAGRMFADAGKVETISSLFLAEDRNSIDLSIRSGAPNRLEARARRPGGAIGNFEIILEMRADGRYVALLIDRTAEKRDQRRMDQEIDRARAEVAESTVMLADLSHEMRTPLNAVIGFAETIEQQTFGPVGHENYAQYAEHIRMAGRHLLDLVNTVLDLSKIEADRFSLNRVAANPGAIALESAAMVRGQVEAAGLKLNVDVSDGLPESYVDPRGVRQILLNLLSNAVKFTSDGEISLSARREDDDLVYTVSDSGVGMSAEALKALGSRFTSAHGAGVRGQGGSGLGLSLAISLAELHGGRVNFSSAPGEGLTAQVRLPISAAPIPAKGAILAILSKARCSEECPDASSTATQLDRINAYRRARPRVDAA